MDGVAEAAPQIRPIEDMGGLLLADSDHFLPTRSVVWWVDRRLSSCSPRCGRSPGAELATGRAASAAAASVSGAGPVSQTHARSALLARGSPDVVVTMAPD
jgi:hypothetical protein